VLAVQVSVQFANPAVLGAPDEKVVMVIDKPSAEFLQRPKIMIIDEGADKRLQIGEIFSPLFLYDPWALKRRAFAHGLRLSVKRRQNLGQRTHHVRRQLSGIEQKRQHAALGQASHDKGVLYRRAPPAKAPARIEADRHNCKINRRRQPPIETQFLIEVMAALGKGRIVEEGKPDRLFYLIDEIVGQKNVGNVRLYVRNLRRSLRVEPRLQHRRDELVLGS
jgi:hypothetical protein